MQSAGDALSQPKYAEVVCIELRYEDSRMTVDGHLMGAQLGGADTPVRSRSEPARLRAVHLASIFSF